MINEENTLLSMDRQFSPVNSKFWIQPEPAFYSYAYPELTGSKSIQSSRLGHFTIPEWESFCCSTM